MAVYVKKSSSSLWLACLAVILFATVTSASARFSGVKVTQAEISTICSKASNPGFCLNFLKSDPQTATLDLPGLAKHTIDSAQTSASEILTEIQSLAQKATDPRSKEAYGTCSDTYDDAISNLQDALTYLAARDPGSVNIRVSAAMTDADTCQGELKSVSLAPPPLLMKKINDLEKICGIALIISNMLPK